MIMLFLYDLILILFDYILDFSTIMQLSSMCISKTVIYHNLYVIFLLKIVFLSYILLFLSSSVFFYQQNALTCLLFDHIMIYLMDYLLSLSQRNGTINLLVILAAFWRGEMKAERIDQIEKYISDHRTVTVSNLSEHFDVSVNTIRRDLRILRDSGKIDLVYGGAKIHNSAANTADLLKTYEERNISNSYEKNLVAKAASSLVKENDIIFIDTGTSTVPLMQYLSSFQQLTIVTNSVYVLYMCINFPQLSVIGLPGILKNKTASLVGEQTERMISTLNIDKAFMACSAFSLEHGASNSTLEELPIKRKIISKSKFRYLLLDHSKFDKSALMSFAEPNQFDCIITDQPLAPKYTQYFQSANTSVLIAQP